jgi:GDP-4-dehydro-6-deoxy-D-mannose reductase
MSIKDTSSNVKKALISGGSGFVGVYLAEWLLSLGYTVHALSCNGLGQLPTEVKFHKADITVESEVRSVVSEVQPDEVYHLAAVSSVPDSWKNVRRTFDVNVLGTYHVLDASASVDSNPFVLNVSTAQVYSPKDEMIDEGSFIGPENPYSTSKAMAELLAAQYSRMGKIRVITVRPFNHSGPRQDSSFVLSSLAKQVAEIELGLKSAVVSVGSIDVERDFVDVRDIVKAYWLLLQKGKPGEIYNVSSGRCYSIASAIEILKTHSSIDFQVSIDTTRQHGGPLRLSGNPAKLIKCTGWRQEIQFPQIMLDLLDSWRQKIKPIPAML